MFEAMKEFMKPEIDQMIDQVVDQKQIDNIKSIMKKLEYTPQQAMELLDIPVADQVKFQSKL